MRRPLADVRKLVGNSRLSVISARRGWTVEDRRSSSSTYWNRDEWDVALSDGTVYRIFCDRDTDGWFIDAIVD